MCIKRHPPHQSQVVSFLQFTISSLSPIMKYLILPLTFIFSCTLGHAQLNVFEIVSNSSSTSHMVQIAVNFDLASTLQASEDVSLFAPSDAAIESYATELGMDLETFLTSDQAYDLIQYHLTIGETVLFSEWENGNSIVTAIGHEYVLDLYTDRQSICQQHFDGRRRFPRVKWCRPPDRWGDHACYHRFGMAERKPKSQLCQHRTRRTLGSPKSSRNWER